MHTVKIYIQSISFLIALLLASIAVSAQLVVHEGDTSVLSVREVSGDTYIWELYDNSQGVNFATELGNCPVYKARFVNGKKTGSSVAVEWLKPGEYFYKVIARSSCSDNVKVGRIRVISRMYLKPPTVAVVYDCMKEVAELTASEYEGDLLWSTGETASSILVTQPGEYSVIQISGSNKSLPTLVEVQDVSKPQAPHDAKATPPIIARGGKSVLSAEACPHGTLRWYADRELTQELPATIVLPQETSIYYAVCESDVGCVSEATPVKVTIDDFDNNSCQRIYRNIKIQQFLSPNDDGLNDTWNLDDLLNYCQKCKKKAVVRLYNRWGAKVYEKTNDKLKESPFEGYSDNALDYKGNKLLPPGTYFYIIIVQGEREKTGYIYLSHD